MVWPCLVVATLAAALSTVQGLRNNRGYALSFQGVNPVAAISKGFVDFTDTGIQEIDKEATIVLWAKYLDYSPQNTRVLLSWTNKADLNFVQPFIGYGCYLFGRDIRYEVTDFDLLSWHHYAFTISNGIAKVYVDGREVVSAIFPSSTSLRGPGTSIYMGVNAYQRIDSQVLSHPFKAFLGEADELAVYSRALSASEIEEVMNLGVHSVTNLQSSLILFYDFEISCLNSSSVGLLSSDCSITGTDRVTNLGKAGSDYDLLLGQMNDDFGFGKSWADVYAATAAGCPITFPFATPNVVESMIPRPASQRFETPTVYFITDDQVIEVDMPTTPDASLIKLVRQPADGHLFIKGYEKNPLLLSAEINLTSQVLMYRAPANFSVPTVAEFQVVSGEKHQVHIWPRNPPEVDSFYSMGWEIESLEDDPVVVRLATASISSSGDPIEIFLSSIPSHGELRQLNLFKNLEEVIDSNLREEVGDNITTVNTVVSHPGGALVYTPMKDSSGSNFDEFDVTFRSAITGKIGSKLKVKFSIRPVNDAPVTDKQDIVQVQEDDAEGVIVDLKVFDAEGQAGLVISRLPSKGKLFEVNETGQAMREITSPFQKYQTVGQVKEQFVSKIRRVSSFWGRPPSTAYSAINLIGPPTCPENENPECIDMRLNQPEASLQLGELINYRMNGHSISSSFDILCIVKARYGAGQRATYDLESYPMQRYVQSEASRKPCIMQGTQYPQECNTTLANLLPRGVLEFVNVSRANLRPVQNGVWSPLHQDYVGNQSLVGGEESAAFGDEFEFDHNQFDSYTKESPPFTEFVEVEFDEEVFPIGVEIWSPRGSGATVSISALDPLQQWWSIYTVRPLLNMHTSSLVSNLFIPNVCRTFFTTKVLRLELDTSLETGIPDWNYIDAIKLIGTMDSQPAKLKFPNTKVLYIPDADAFGEDSFGVEGIDCFLNRHRFSDESSVTIRINGTEDDPVAIGSEVPYIFTFDKDFIPIYFSAVEKDGQPFDIIIDSMPAYGTLFYPNGSSIQVGIPINTNRIQRQVILHFTVNSCRSPQREFVQIPFSVVNAVNKTGSSKVAISIDCGSLPHRYEINEVSTGASSYALALSILGLLLTTGAIMFNKRFARLPVVSLTSPRINIVMLCGLGMVYAFLATFQFKITSLESCTTDINWDLQTLRRDNEMPDYTCSNESNQCCRIAAFSQCYLRLLLLAVGTVVSYGALFQKTLRIVRLFHSKTIRLHITDGWLLRGLAALTGVTLLYLLIWALASPIRVEFQKGVPFVSIDEQIVVVPLQPSCTSDFHAVFTSLLIGLFVLLFGFGCRLAYEARKVYISVCNDGPQIFLSVYNSTIFGGLNLALSAVVVDPSFLLYILASTTFLTVTTTVVVLFVPRMLDVFRGETDISSRFGIRRRSGGPSKRMVPYDSELELMTENRKTFAITSLDPQVNSAKRSFTSMDSNGDPKI